MKCALYLLAATALVLQTETPAAYKYRMAKWRIEQEAALKADEGWLSVAGLIWLKEGDTTIGSDASAVVRLPASTPAKVGVLHFANGSVDFTPAEGEKKTLKPDQDRVALGSVTFMVIR